MWLLTLGAILVAACAALAALGFRGRVSTVGVDLGTTFSVVGINRHGKVEIVSDDEGHLIFPSVIAYLDDGEIKAAHAAQQYLNSRPVNTIYNAKRFIGRRCGLYFSFIFSRLNFTGRCVCERLEDDEVQEYAAQHPYRIVNGSTASNYSEVGFDISASGHPDVVSPEQVGTQVLKFLMQLTANYLGHNQVNKAVIAVPAKFTPEQRQATGEAYKRAGLKVVRVMEEPTAAAVAYRLHKRTDIHHILVYDFGGGTLDVSLLYVAKGSVEVYATDGDDALGGSDFDLCLYRNMKQKIYNITGQQIEDLPAGAGDDCSSATVHGKAEEIKKQFTEQEIVHFNCTLPKDSDTASSTGRLVEFEMHRDLDFEQGCEDLFTRSMVPVHRLLDDLEMSVEDVDEIVLVGGTTRVPKVKQQLKEYFRKELNDRIDPDVTVAYGAALILD